MCRSSSGRWWYKACVASLLTTHAVLLGWLAWVHAPNGNEPAHLAAGVHTWLTGRFDVYRVNPPLVRMVATIPVVLANPNVSRLPYRDEPGMRLEWRFGQDFLRANGVQRSLRYLAMARLSLIPALLLGAWVCWRWACDLYGAASGLLALLLWCFSPNLIGWGATICPDAVAASAGVVAGYAFWLWLREPKPFRLMLAGVTLGMALLCKMTSIILLGLWPILWLIGRRANRQTQAGDGRRPSRLGLIGILLLALYVLNGGYGFQGSFTPLGQFDFVSEAFAGRNDGTAPQRSGNRFSHTWVGRLPVPFPRDYVLGIDLQRRDFEQRRWSYLRGEWKRGGWWYYYLYGLAVKVPLGTLGLVLLAVTSLVSRTRCRTSWRDEVFLLAPVVAVLILVSSQTGINHHLRYVLLVFPFAFVWVSRTAVAFACGYRKMAASVVLLAACSVGNTLWHLPHALSYFNALVGGPANGYRHLLGSNLDWGQDLLFLRSWIRRNPQARPLYVAGIPGYDLSLVGIRFPEPSEEPQRGWYAISVSRLYHFDAGYRYLRSLRPTSTISFSIWVFRLTEEDAKKLGRQPRRPLHARPSVRKQSSDEHFGNQSSLPRLSEKTGRPDAAYTQTTQGTE